MNFDFGEVLSRAWQTTWNRRVLWVIGIVFGLFVSLMFPLLFSPMLVPILVQRSRTDLAFIVLGVTILGFVLFMLLMYPISVLAQTSLTLGVLDADRQEERTSLSDLIKRSLPFFWRVLGLLLLFALGMTAANLILQAIVFFFAIITFGLGMVCFGPLMLLYYPLLYAAIVWEEQAMNALIIDNMTVMEAARQGWKLLRNNLGTFAVMALIVYFGVGMVTGFLLVPVLAPLFVAPFAFLGHQVNWVVIAIAVTGLAVFIPLFGILSGLCMVFTKSAWVLTYLRLARSPKPPPLPQEAAP